MSDTATSTSNKKETYEPGALVRFFAPKNCENIEAAENLYDLVDLTNGAAYNTMELSGYSEEEIEAYKAQQDASSDEGRAEMIGRVRKDCRTAATINGVSDVLSVAGGLMTVSGLVSTATAKSSGQLISEKLTEAAAEGGIKGTANKVAAQVFKAGELQTSASGKLLAKSGKTAVSAFTGKDVAKEVVKDAAGNVIKETTKHVSYKAIGKTVRLIGAAGLGATGFAVELAPAVVPHVASRMYTEGKADELKQEILEATEAQQAIYDYITAQNGQLPAELQEDYDKWAEAYETGQADLLEAYNSGKITKAEYDEKYEAFVNTSQESLDAMTDAHKEMGDYILNEGAANAASEYMIAHGKSPVEIENANSYIKELDEKNPDAAKRAQAAYDAKQKLDTGSALTDFLANMNAAIVHYLPGAAYVEAAIVKGLDVALDFLANKAPVVSGLVNYNEKHADSSIADMAAQICDSAEARYELNQEVRQAEAAASEGMSADKQAEAADAAIEAMA